MQRTKHKRKRGWLALGAVAALALVVILADQGRLPGSSLEPRAETLDETEPAEPGPVVLDPSAGEAHDPDAPPRPVDPERNAPSTAPAGERTAIPREARLATGVVTDTSGNPLANVHVRWCDDAGAPLASVPEFLTRGNGSYELAPHAGSTVLGFQCMGYLPDTLDTLASPSGDMTLLASPVVRGFLRGSEGVPVEPPGHVALGVHNQIADDVETYETELEWDGSFRFDGLPLGRILQVEARAKGFDTLREARDELLEAERTVDLDLVLPRGLTIVGVVSDAETGLPVPHARVWSRHFSYEEGSTRASTTADAEGRYRLEGVEREERDMDGRSLFVVWISGDSPDHTSSPWSPAFVLEDAQGICHKNLSLVPSSCSLAVVFYEPGLQQVAQGVRVWIVDAEKNFSHQATNRHGEIELTGLPAGNLGLVAYREQRNASGDHVSLVVELELAPGSQDRIELELRTDPGTTIEGRLRDLQGLPAVDALVVARFDLFFNGLSIPLDEESQRTDQDGRYSFRRLRAGRYRIDPAGCALPRDRRLDLEAGATRSDEDFTVGDCMVVRGQVELGGRSSDGLFVSLIHPESGERIRSTRLEDDGRFEFDETLGRTYTVLLLEGQVELARTQVHPERPDGVVLQAP